MSAESRTFKKVIRARRKRALAKKKDPGFRAFRAHMARVLMFPNPQAHAVPDPVGN